MKNNNNNKQHSNHLCDRFIKDIMKGYHKKCSDKKSYRKSVMMGGDELNVWMLGRDKKEPFNSNQKYRICGNLHRLLLKGVVGSTIVPEVPSYNIEELELVEGEFERKNSMMKMRKKATKKNPSDVVIIPSMNREERLKRRNRIGINDPKLLGIKGVRVIVDDSEDGIIDLTKSRVSSNQKFVDDVLHKRYYRVPFGRLTMRQRRLRMRELSTNIISSCIDRLAYKNNPDKYLHKNNELAVDILSLIDGIKECIEKKLKVSLKDIEEEAMVPIDDDNDGLINVLDENKKGHQIAISLLGETGVSGYTRIKKYVDAAVQLPSYYMITKGRPKVLPLAITVMKNIDMIEERENAIIESDDINDTTNYSSTTTNTTPTAILTDGTDDLEEALRQCSQSKDILEGAKLEGDYSKYINLLEDKHKRKGRLIGNNEQVIILDSIDGAEHLKSKKKITSIISFSSAMYAPSWINTRSVTAGSSHNILTWQQLNATESLYTMMPSVKEYFTNKKVLRNDQNRNNYWYYDLHDGKMLYLLTNHSLWNRKYNPFLLCTCGRGEGVRNTEHICVPKSHEQQIQSWNRSEKRWKLKKAGELVEVLSTSKKYYTYKAHLDWIDKNNDGVSHFGLHPNLLPRDGIRFDVFHMRCAITRKLMNYLRCFLLEQSNAVIDSFLCSVLKKFFNDYHIYIWKHKKSFSSFQGNEIALFVANKESINKFLSSNLVSTQKLQDICAGLTLWLDIFKFLAITSVKEGEGAEYLNKLQVFEQNLKKFYSIGSRTFLSVPDKVGSTETFYMHALRYYMPQIGRITYEKHATGVGIFTMQGFERRNKESKNCMKRFSNNLGNRMINNMRRVWDIFEHDINAY